jgi:phage terminase small subunit
MFLLGSHLNRVLLINFFYRVNGFGSVVKKNKLTPKQKRFIDEYLVDLNATQAAIRAGYSKRTACFIGYENLTKPQIKEALGVAQENLSRRTQVTQEQVIAELAAIAFANIGDVMSWGPGGVLMKSAEELPPEVLASVADVSNSKGKEGGTIRIKLHDKLKALELLGKHLGLFVEKVEVGLRPIFTFGDEGS